MKLISLRGLTGLLDHIGLDGDRIAFKAELFAHKLGYVKKVANQSPYDFGTFKFYIDPYDTLKIANSPQFEQFEVDTLLSKVKEDSIVVDIGANLGYYSVRVAQKATAGKVYAFEPDPGNYAILKKNLAINNLSNVIAQNIALGDSDDVLRLWKHPFNGGDYRLYNDGDFTEYVDVPTRRLDDLVTEKVDILKIDVQGYEYFVFSGGLKLLEQHPIIFSEFWPRGLRNSGASPEDYLNLMIKYDYAPTLVDNDKKVANPVSYDYLFEFSKKSTTRFLDLMFT